MFKINSRKIDKLRNASGRFKFYSLQPLGFVSLPLPMATVRGADYELVELGGAGGSVSGEASTITVCCIDWVGDILDCRNLVLLI